MTHAQNDAALPRNGSSYKHLFLFIPLVAVNYLIFSPAFVRVFAMDHITYVAELHGSNRLADGLALCDYSLARRIFKGDEMLYRPLLFAWMAVENSVFSFDHVCWNIANFVLHISVVFLLWKLLSLINPSPFAFVFAFLFSVLTAQVELVMWCHLGGYLWACIFMLCGLYCARLCADPETRNRTVWLVGYAVFFSLGAFFYEFCVVMSILTGIFLARTFYSARSPARPRFAAAALLAPVAIYAAFYIPHYLHAPRFWYRYGFEEGESFGNPDQFIAAFSAMADFTKHALMPSSIQWTIKPFSRLAAVSTGILQLPWELLSLVPAIGFSALLITREKIRENGAFAYVLAFSIFAYVLMIVTGRHYLCLYYNYVFDLLAITLLYSLMDFSSRPKSMLKIYALVLAGFIGFNSYLSYGVSETCRQQNLQQHRFYSQLVAFVAKHRTEPGFSVFMEETPAELDRVFLLRPGYPKEHLPDLLPRVSEILLEASYNKTNPRYTLRWDPDTAQLVATKN